MLEYHVTTDVEKSIISDWKYAGDYSIYNSNYRTILDLEIHVITTTRFMMEHLW